MRFEVDLGQFSARGPRAVNEDCVAGQRPAAGESARGVVAAIADGVASGGGGRLAAQTTVLRIVLDDFSAPQTRDTTVVLDRLIGAQNSWLVAHNRRAEDEAMCTRTALVVRGQTWTVTHIGATRADLLPLLQCDPTALWKVALAVSALFNLLLVVWLLCLPTWSRGPAGSRCGCRAGCQRRAAPENRVDGMDIDRAPAVRCPRSAAGGVGDRDARHSP